MLDWKIGYECNSVERLAGRKGESQEMEWGMPGSDKLCFTSIFLCNVASDVGGTGGDVICLTDKKFTQLQITHNKK
jgi:hypothetical protein